MRTLLLHYIIILIGLFGSHQLLAQEKPMQVGLHYNRSLFFVTDRNQHLSQTIPTSFELSFYSRFSGEEEWHQIYHLPQWGIVAGYYDYHSDILGKMYSLSYVFNQPLFKTKRSKLSLPFQFGGVYTPSHFDINSNPLNNAIGNPVSFLIAFAVDYQYLFSQHWSVTASLKLQHFSNGALGVPNDGLNIFSPTLGLNYHFGKQKEFEQIKTIYPNRKKIYFGLLGSLGAKEIRPFWDKKYFFFNLSAYIEYPLGKISALQLGVDAFYNLGEKADIEQYWNTRAVQDDRPDFKQAAVFLGHELALGQLAFITQLGFYIYKPYENDKKMYQRIGLKYYWKRTRKLFSSMTLKTHGFGASDGIEWGLGYRF